MLRNIHHGLSKAMSFLMHSPLLSIHFYHTQSSFLAPQTFLFHSMLFSRHPSLYNCVDLTHTVLLGTGGGAGVADVAVGHLHILQQLQWGVR